jgi:hypothetical protein
MEKRNLQVLEVRVFRVNMLLYNYPDIEWEQDINRLTGQ